MHTTERVYSGFRLLRPKKEQSGLRTMKRHAFATFVILAFALSWYPWLLHLSGLVPRASGMNPLGVIAAAFITAALVHGRAGAKELLSRLIRFRVHLGWYAFALGFPIVVALTALGISVLLGAKLDQAASVAACRVPSGCCLGSLACSVVRKRNHLGSVASICALSFRRERFRNFSFPSHALFCSSAMHVPWHGRRIR